MENIILISFSGEGPTDDRFFSNITQRLISQLLLEEGREGIIQWQAIPKRGGSAQEIVYNASIQARFSSILILHSDTDNNSVEQTIQNKFKSALDLITACNEADVCKNIALAIPITETESWMLADKELLKSEMNTNLSNQQLGLTYQQNRIEHITDPKKKINDAIEIHHQSLPKKRRKYSVEIEDLYESVGQNINLTSLETLNSYQNFKSNIIEALKKKGILKKK